MKSESSIYLQIGCLYKAMRNLRRFCQTLIDEVFIQRNNKFKYVLSTMGVSKESISKFSIGNRFHVKLRILSPYSNVKQQLSLALYSADAHLTFSRFLSPGSLPIAPTLRPVVYLTNAHATEQFRISVLYRTLLNHNALKWTKGQIQCVGELLKNPFLAVATPRLPPRATKEFTETRFCFSDKTVIFHA